MNVKIAYNSNDVTPNDGYEYDERALAGEFERRFEAHTEKLIASEYPDADVEFDWHSSSLHVYVSAENATLENQAENRIKELLIADSDVWKGIEWNQFLTA